MDATTQGLIDAAGKTVADKYKIFLQKQNTNVGLYNQYNELYRQYNVHKSSGYAQGIYDLDAQIRNFVAANGHPEIWERDLLKTKADYDAAVDEFNKLKTQILTKNEQELADQQAAAALEATRLSALANANRANQSNTTGAPPPGSNPDQGGGTSAPKAMSREKKQLYIVGGILVTLVIAGIVWFFATRTKKSD
jgi:hypothetical protein